MITKKYASSHLFSYACSVKGSQGTDYLVVYDVSRYEPSSGHTSYRDWSCTCEDWNQRRRVDGGYCKHIRAVIRLTPEQGGMSTWVEDDMSTPVFKLNHESRMHMSQWVDFIKSFGDTGLCENASAAADAFLAIDDAFTAHVPGLMYNGDMIVAVQADDYRSTNIKQPRIAPDLDYGAKRTALLAQFDNEDQFKAANPPAKPPKPMAPPSPMPSTPLKAAPYRPGLPTPKRPGGN